MANDAQHSQWRDDIRSNIKKALKTADETDDPRVEAIADVAAAVATSIVIMSERVNEQTISVLGRDEYVRKLEHDINGISADLVSFCLKIEKGEKQEFKDLQEDAKLLREQLEGFEIDQRYARVIFDG